MEIRDQQGQVIFVKTNPSGSEQDINAEAPLSFVIGNAAEVKMTYNGKPFDLTPHMDGGVARFTLK